MGINSHTQKKEGWGPNKGASLPVEFSTWYSSTWKGPGFSTWKLSEPHSIWTFMDTSLHRHDRWNHRPLLTDSAALTLPFPGIGSTLLSSTHLFVDLTNRPSLVFSSITSLIQASSLPLPPHCRGRGLVMITETITFRALKDFRNWGQRDKY